MTIDLEEVDGVIKSLDFTKVKLRKESPSIVQYSFTKMPVGGWSVVLYKKFKHLKSEVPGSTVI